MPSLGVKTQLTDQLINTRAFLFGSFQFIDIDDAVKQIDSRVLSAVLATAAGRPRIALGADHRVYESGKIRLSPQCLRRIVRKPSTHTSNIPARGRYICVGVATMPK